MAKKTKTKESGSLSDIAESLGVLLGNAEKQWRAWQGPRDAVVNAVTDVRDRAAALLSEMGTSPDTAADKGSKKSKKKKKGKKDNKGKKDKKDRSRAGKAATKDAGKAEKKKSKGERAARRKTGQKNRTSTATPGPAAPLAAAPGAGPTSPDAGDTNEP